MTAERRRARAGGHEDRGRPGRGGRALLLSGAAFCAAAVAFRPELAPRLAPYPPGLLSPLLPEYVTSARLFLGATALVLAAAGLLIRPRGRLDGFVARHRLALAAILGVVLAEALLQPFVPVRAAIFEADPERGWRHEPGSTAIWGGARVVINSRGLRGPDRPYAKPSDVRRILALGDSVPFGFSLAEADTFPARLEARLRGRGERVEVINAGVAGYSPWQLRAFLASEGLRYQPDLVLVSVTLNDVDEKFMLRRFGGRSDGVQLLLGNPPAFMRSGVVFSFWSWRFFAIAGARYTPPEPETLREISTAAVLRHPTSPVVEEAWRITLDNLKGVVDLCRERGVPLLLVVFPFTVQFEEPHLDAPQRRFAEFARRSGVPVLDMLEQLRARARALGVDPAELFLDMSHLSPLGAGVTAEAIVERLDEIGAPPGPHEAGR